MYFIINRILPIVIIFILIDIGLSALQNVVLKTPFLLKSLPFDPHMIAGTGTPVATGLGVIICLFLVLGAWVDYASVKFMFDEFAFHIQNGIFSKSEIAIPYRQIQNVNHDQSLTEKMWGMTRVIVETAGTDDVRSAESSGDLPVLDSDTAQMLEQELLKRSSGK